MGKVFRFSAKEAAPSTHLAVVPDAEEQPPELEKQVRALLFRFELAEEEQIRLRADHPEVFEKLDRIAQEQEEARDAMKRLLHTKSGPPDQVRPGSASHVWARGNLRYVEVQYKKKGSYYEPDLLPKAVFMLPGVVVDVDKDILNQLAKKDGRIARALKQGDWMTPALSIPRIVRGDPSEPSD